MRKKRPENEYQRPASWRNKIANAKKSHGMTGTPIYQVWSGIKKRCENKANQDWHNYGGRGITVCERWQKFENFYADMGDKPAGKSLDRINNDGNYEPSNCRWATKFEQCMNMRRNKKLEVNGKTYSLAEASHTFKVKYGTLVRRLRLGWSREEALNLKERKSPRWK